MNDTWKERLTYIIIHRPKRDTVMQVADLLQNTNERQIVLALSHQWLKEIRQNVMQFRGTGEFTLKICREIIEKKEKGPILQNYKKLPL